jgi:alpha-tubulin suppressor-like RCC1 family protein
MGALTLAACSEQTVEPNGSDIAGDALSAKPGGKPGGGGKPGSGTPIVFQHVEPGPFRHSNGATTCGLDVGGKAYCWGSNFHKTLGTGKKKSIVNVPTPVVGALTFHEITVGFLHTCGIEDVGGAASGPAYCWGYNFYGQLGNGSTELGEEPLAVSGSHTFRQISASGRTTCGIKDVGAAAGPAYCWGANGSGQLGDGTQAIDRTEPVPVSGGLNFRRVVTGPWSTCALTQQDEAYCWGNNSEGQLGIGTVGGFSLVPAAVSGGRRFESVATEAWRTCGLTSAADPVGPGTILCWGDALAGGPSVPTVLDLGGITDLPFTSLSDSFCAIGASGQAYCWGDNSFGQIGNGTSGTEWNSIPAPVEAPQFFTSIGGKGVHNCGIGVDGFAYCWGWNNGGELGDGTRTFSDVPVKVANQ